eukprot:SAG11_NODE_4662_length_1816_cov_4.829936_2_plen_83_part_00
MEQQRAPSTPTAVELPLLERLKTELHVDLAQQTQVPPPPQTSIRAILPEALCGSRSGQTLWAMSAFCAFSEATRVCARLPSF